MKRIAKIVLVGVAAVATVIVVIIGALMSAFSGMCGNAMVAEYMSPDGRAKLVVFHRDCGATTDFSTQASLVMPDATLPGSSGNLFIADSDQGLAPEGPGGGPELRVRWDGPKTLLLLHHPKARVFKAERRLNGVEVRYEPLP